MENIVENNRLIAEFMGLGNWTTFYIPEFGHYFNSYGTIEYTETFSESELKYHSSWNWLMPVCYKISEIIKDKYNIENLTPLDELFDILSGGLYYTNDDLKVSTNIMEVYSDVITFIKWYNSQQK